MPDVTDSYCERCGARYVFSPNASKGLSLKGARVLAKGLKNFVLTDGQSMADALALARVDDEHDKSTRMTEAFHKTFNFCITCRQYACDRCWNSRVGACLSCAPEPGYEPVAPEDHLIVRTPVARWDTDWSLFPDGPALESVERPAPPTRFDEPIHLVEPQSEPRPQPAAPPAWPTADLPAAGTAPEGTRGRRSSRKPADPEAASLWPIADEIAPEMTLTPEELELVESRLGHGETSPSPAPGWPAAPEPPLFEARPSSSTPQPTFADAPAQASALTSDGPARIASPAPATESAAAEAEDTPDTTSPIARQPVAREPQAQVPPQRILRMPLATPPLSPTMRPMPQPPAHAQAPIVARLLGRQEADAEAPASAHPRSGAVRRSQIAGDPWPAVTKWSDRPIDAHDRWADTDASVGSVPPATAPYVAPAPAATGPLPVPEPVAAPAPQDTRPAPAPPWGEPAHVDARSAAAVRLSAVATGDSEPIVPTELQPIIAVAPAQEPARPATQQPLFDLSLAAPGSGQSAAPEQLGWPEADREIGDAARSRSSRTSDAAQAQQSAPAASVSHALAQPPAPPSTAPNPWPPLGASWPADKSPGAPWPGPETAPVPAFVAAGHEVPTLAEMWVQSSQEVLSRGTVRVCHRCALPVSTQARFCRRCGTPTGVGA